MRDVQRLNDKSDEKIRRSQRAQEDAGRIVQGRCSHNRVNHWKILKRGYQRENGVQYDYSDVVEARYFRRSALSTIKEQFLILITLLIPVMLKMFCLD